MTKQTPPFADILRDAGLRATSQRVSMLRALSRLDRPVTITELKAAVADIDPVTLYRSLSDMAKAGIVRTVELKKAYLHYEIVATKKHHHHASCVSCGRIEDVDACLPKALEARVLESLRHFHSLTGHTLEFVGVCRACASHSS
jgi:Fe2+ or Zn2+ uptake regulation protein